MMTNAIEIVDKAIMERKTYTKPEVQKMIADIKAKTRWSRDEIIRRAQLPEGIAKSIQRSKDWYRKDRDIQIDHLDAICIAELYQKISSEEKSDDLQIARRLINSALKIWFEDGDSLAINALAKDAYNILRTPNEQNIDRSTDGMILSCIIKIQSSKISLNEQESTFSMWFASEHPKSFKDNMRKFMIDFLGADNVSKNGEISKSNLLKLIKGRSDNSAN